VARWLARWARGEGAEETKDAEGNAAATHAPPASAPPPLLQTSQQILRGYLFYPLEGAPAAAAGAAGAVGAAGCAVSAGRTGGVGGVDGGRGSGGWSEAGVTGTASPGHLRGWWVNHTADLAKVPGSHGGVPGGTGGGDGGGGGGGVGGTGEAGAGAVQRTQQTVDELMGESISASNGGDPALTTQEHEWTGVVERMEGGWVRHILRSHVIHHVFSRRFFSERHPVTWRALRIWP